MRAKEAPFRILNTHSERAQGGPGPGLPVAAVQVGMMFMGVVDTVMVGHFSARDLAAVALGNLYFFTAVVFPMGLLMSLDPVVSQAVGAGDRSAVAGPSSEGASWLLLLYSGRPGPGPGGDPPDLPPAASGGRAGGGRICPGLHPRDLPLPGLHRLSPDPPGHGAGGSHRGDHRPGQPGEPLLQLGSDLREPGFSDHGCGGIGVGFKPFPVVDVCGLLGSPGPC